MQFHTHISSKRQWRDWLLRYCGWLWLVSGDEVITSGDPISLPVAVFYNGWLIGSRMSRYFNILLSMIPPCPSQRGWGDEWVHNSMTGKWCSVLWPDHVLVHYMPLKSCEHMVCVLRPYSKSTSQSWLLNYYTHPLLSGGLHRLMIDNELKHYFVAVCVLDCIRHSRLPMK